jgi:hypothetical protein
MKSFAARVNFKTPNQPINLTKPSKIPGTPQVGATLKVTETPFWSSVDD